MKTINVRGVRDLAARMAGLETGELDLAYGMTGKLLQRVMADPKLRWDPNFTAPWHLVFPGYNEPSSPFHDKRVRQAVSLAINRQFLVKQETQGIGKPWGNWISHENRDALRGDGTELPVPSYDPTKAKQLLAEAGFPNGFDFDWYVPFVPYFDMAERILNDLRAVGMRSKLQMLDAPAYMAQTSKGRKGFPGNRTIVQRIDPRPGGAKELIRLYAVCDGPASYICEPNIESLWAKHEASIDVAERDRLSKEIQRAIVEGYYLVPALPQSLRARRHPEGASRRRGGAPLLGHRQRSLSRGPGRSGRSRGSVAPLLRVNDLQTHYFGFGGTRVVKAVDGVSFICRSRRNARPRRRVRLRQDHDLPLDRRPAAAERAHRRRQIELERRGPDQEERSARCGVIRGRAIAMILQDPMASLNPLFSIYTQVAEPAYYHRRLRGRTLRQRVKELLAAVRIPSPATRMRGLSPPDERRHAPAHRRRHRPGRRPEAHHRRRAHHQPRRHHPGPVSGPAEGPPARRPAWR